MAIGLLKAALDYGELGYPVFPCVPGSKKPLTEHGPLDATTDPGQIQQWWQQRPNANIGISTTGLLVLDLDAKNTWHADDHEKLSELTIAPLSLTANGGRQYVFRQPLGKAWRNTTSRLAPCVDTRADGGYIVASPSVLTGGKAYTWAEGMALDEPPAKLPEPPPWLIAELDTMSYETGATTRVVVPGGDSDPIPAGQRNDTLARLAGTMRRVGMSKSEMYAALEQVNLNRCQPPLDQQEVERIATSVARYPPNEIAVALAENHYAQMYASEAQPGGPPDPGPFPESLLTVPGYIDQVVQYNLTGAIKPQPVLALAAAIALVGTITGRKITDQYGTRTNVYCLGVCQSGGGKERARQVNKDILLMAGLENMIGPEGIASHAGW